MIHLRKILTALVIVAVGKAHGLLIYDESQVFTCQGNQTLSHFHSLSENPKEDRSWNFGCTNLSESIGLEECSWSGNANPYNQPFGYICPDNKVMAGMATYHYNRFQDRHFKFMCCSAADKVVHGCEITKNANSYGGSLIYTVPADRVLTGVVSHYNTNEEDRIFRFIICKLGTLCLEDKSFSDMVNAAK